MNEFRCRQCNRLLAKIEGRAKVEIKCPRCKTINLYAEEIYITIETKAFSVSPEETKEDSCTEPGTAES